MSRQAAKEDVNKRMPLILKFAIVLAIAVIAGFTSLFWRGGHSSPATAHSGREASEAPAVHAAGTGIEFRDSAAQAREFIGYYNTIHLTPEQEALKAEVLQARPAACCKSSNAYTCCCTCNLSKTVWGLSNYAIAKQHVNAKELNELVDGWLSFVNPSGYEGDTCYTGGCGLPGNQKGCGGMTEQELSL
jgi:hypothetical protein